jgi:hypothetical protein
MAVDPTVMREVRRALRRQAPASLGADGQQVA